MIGILDEQGHVSRIHLLAPLRLRDFRLLWTGMTLSLLGDGVLLVALAWQAYQLSNRPAAMSLIGVALTVPQVVLVLVGGVVSDRLERRKVMLVADAVRGVALALLAWLTFSGSLALWHMVAFAAVYGAASAFFMPAFEALVPSIVPEEELVEANALDQFVRPAALWLLGPALGGALIGWVGTGWAFTLDAASFAVSAACLLRLTRNAAVGGARHDADEAGDHAEPMTVRSALLEMREGLAFVRREPWLWATLAAASLTYLLFLGPTEVLLPYLVKNELGGDAHDVGLILAAGGLAAVAAALVIGQTGLPTRRMTFTYVVWALATLGVAGYGIAGARWQAMIAGALIAGFEALGAVAWMTTKQRLIPEGLMGRVSSFDWFISIALVPVSYAVTAPIADALGVRETLVGAGVLGALVTLGFLLVPGVRTPDRGEAVPA
jgi:MFS family permease